MRTIATSQARAELSRLLDRAAQGERILITRRGRPVAELGSIRSEPALTPIEAAPALRALRVGVTLGDAALAEVITEGRA